MTRRFRDDLHWWIENDARTAGRIMTLVDQTLRDPTHGIGKPEPLRFVRADLWSRRITQEHRLVYRVLDDEVHFLQARYHYGS